MTSSPLAGQVALVTGASRGIGRAIALHLGELGADVAVNYNRAEAAAAQVVELLTTAGRRACALQADVGKPDQAATLVERATDSLGQVDILVNNAGLQRSAMLHKMSDADWHDVVDVNMHALFYCCRAVLPQMRQRKAGQIVNIASASSFMGQVGAASYVASKHAVIGLTKALALETARKGIRVNAVAPGLTETDLVADLTDEQRAQLLEMVPMGRLATPDEVAVLVGTVVTRARYSTGNVFHASGGVVMG